MDKLAEQLAKYAQLTAADNDCDYDAAVRMMDDEPAEVARALGITVEQVQAWCAAQGGYGSAIVVTQDPEAPGRCVAADSGAPVWPPHGRSTGTVRWEV